MKSKGFRPDWLLFILMAAAVIGLITWAMKDEIARNPSREAMVELGSYGMVTVEFKTDPYPVSTTGTTGLEFMFMTSRGQPIVPDSFSFEYGRKGSDQAIGSGTIQPMPDGSGMLMTSAQFPSAGSWWVRGNFSKDDFADNVQFAIEVKPE
jgi:hypothetical protein